MKIEFVTSNGDTVSAHAEVGDNLLRVAQAAGLPLEGTCEGQMACSTSVSYTHLTLPTILRV